MVDNVEIVNRSLQTMGAKTTVTALQLTNNSSNEAIQANLILTKYRDNLLRMAPWDCGMNAFNLQLISSAPGTQENVSPAPNQWQKGLPPPPWAYEYQYPVDCLRACYIIPAAQAGYVGAVPITTAITGGATSYWRGPPVRFNVMLDQFFPVTAATVAAGGTGYVVGERITLASGPTNEAPIGAPVVLQVATLAGSAVATVTVVNQIAGSATPQGGSYFAPQANPVAQGSSTGAGTGATFNLTFGPQGDQRVIVTNQENATLFFVRQITDPNVMDPLFQEAWIRILGGGMAKALTSNLKLANHLIAEANQMIVEARKVDGNEGLTVNDVTPDWIRARGINFDNSYYGPYSNGFEWGALWPLF